MVWTVFSKTEAMCGKCLRTRTPLSLAGSAMILRFYEKIRNKAVNAASAFGPFYIR